MENRFQSIRCITLMKNDSWCLNKIVWYLNSHSIDCAPATLLYHNVKLLFQVSVYIVLFKLQCILHTWMHWIQCHLHRYNILHRHHWHSQCEPNYIVKILINIHTIRVVFCCLRTKYCWVMCISNGSTVPTWE